ncbi:MAG: beta-propeller fold lactonase family protein [Candidatus Melainabacteria bacterium]|nr:beta-propeller fold lactonase family protein [Candidatus Melainabacteria bacterium]
MKQFIHFSLSLFLLFSLFVCCLQPVLATRLSAELKTAVVAEFPESKIRLDGAIETKAGQLYLPLMPQAAKVSADKSAKTAANSKPSTTAKTSTAAPSTTASSSGTAASGAPVQLRDKFPETEQPDALFFSNGWCYLRVIKKGTIKTTLSSTALSEKLRKELFSCKFVPDLIVPDNFSLTKAMKPLAGDLAIAILPEAAPTARTPGTVVPATTKATGQTKTIEATGHGAVFVCSPGTGKITMLDDKTLEKLTEFPTEGTPAGMCVAEGRLYIADQGKSRILILDPKKRQFLGQIDLTPKSAPKGLASLPNGKLIYASESAAGNIDVIETETGKVLLKTKVLAGPSRVVMAPNGNMIVVLNPPSGQVTLITTSNQKVFGVVKVGANPNAVVFSKDSAFAYVSNRVSNTVTIIDLAKRQAVGNLETGAGPTGLAMTNDGEKLLVANAKDNSISVFDVAKRTKLQDIRLPLDVDFPSALFLMPDGEHLLV